MRRYLIGLFSLLLIIGPAQAWADDPPKDESSDKKSVKEADATTKRGGDAEKSETVSPVKKLVEIRLDPFLVPARALNLPFMGRIQTVRDLLDQFDKWSRDDEIGAILLNLDGLALSMPDIEELRSGVAGLRKSGKKVVAFINSGDPMSYLVACQADEIAMAPTGNLAIPGLGRLFPFMRGMYQLQGIEFDVITAGAYKYPGFMNQRESNKYFREEFNDIMDSWFEDYVAFIAQGRNLSSEKVHKIIDEALFDAQDAKERGLVDIIAYYDEYVDRVVRREKFKKAGDFASQMQNITSLQDLLSTISKQIKDAQESYKAVGPKIAVLHARGPIIDMTLPSALASSVISRDTFVKTIEEIRKNKTVQAVVLHIDSPGGSGYASDVIWRKLKELDEEKPLIVSMGSVAGSGGYYIACPGRLIFAEPTTITGSIGVLAVLANQASMLNRMDVNLEEMKRGERSLFGAGHRDMKPEDRDFLQKYILDFYEIFLDRVAAGRKIPKEEVRKLAGGRIYTGRQALNIGLVDRLGGLKEAIQAAREAANIPTSAEIKLVHYPRPSSLGEWAESLFSFAAMADVMNQVDRPAARVSFDSQVRYFAQFPKPLCWMGMPDVHQMMDFGPSMLTPTLDLMSPWAPMQTAPPFAVPARP